MAHAHCRVDTEDYKHTLRIGNTYCFTTATVVARTRLSVTLFFTLPVLLHNENIKPLMTDSRLHCIISYRTENTVCFRKKDQCVNAV
jgi:hypothetical protein